MKYLPLIGLAVLIIVQWFIPLDMIKAREKVLDKGTLFRLETEPVDPSMPFTGKYVWLNYKISNYTTSSKDSLATGDNVFAIFETDTTGFAKIKSITKKPPIAIPGYVKAFVSSTYEKNDTVIVTLNFPFTKYYMDEYKAPVAERQYREANIDSAKKTYALVKVLNGEAVIKDVMIDNTPLRILVNGRH